MIHHHHRQVKDRQRCHRVLRQMLPHHLLPPRAILKTRLALHPTLLSRRLHHMISSIVQSLHLHRSALLRRATALPCLQPFVRRVLQLLALSLLLKGGACASSSPIRPAAMTNGSHGEAIALRGYPVSVTAFPSFSRRHSRSTLAIQASVSCNASSSNATATTYV